MDCFEIINGNVNETNINPIETGNKPIEINNKWVARGTLSQELRNLFKRASAQYGINWKWLAALSYCESNWNSSVKNSLGYSYEGLCGFSQSTITNTLGKGHSSKSAEDQAFAAAKNIALNYNTAKKYGFDDESCYLYAGICHNAGVGGAKWAYNNANPKTIEGIRQALLTHDGGYGPHGNKVGWFKVGSKEANRQNREKAEYPVKMKSAYYGIKE